MIRNEYYGLHSKSIKSLIYLPEIQHASPAGNWCYHPQARTPGGPGHVVGLLQYPVVVHMLAPLGGPM